MFETLDGARLWMATHKQKLKEKGAVALRRKGQPDAVCVHLQKLLCELILVWFERHRENLTVSTVESYRAALNDHILPTFGKLRLGELSRETVIDFVEKQKSRITFRGTVTDPKTVENRLLVLSLFVEDCVARGFLGVNVVHQARKFCFPKRSRLAVSARQAKHIREHFLTADEVQALLRVAASYGSRGKKGVPSPWNEGEVYWPILFLLLTGLRIGELCALVWKDYETCDLLGNAFVEPRIRVCKTALRFKDITGEHIIQDSTKGKVERFVPVNEELKTTLARWRSLAEQYGYDTSPKARIFPICSGYLAFKALIRRVAMEAGFPTHKQGAHTLRHAVATHLVGSGEDLSKVQRVLGHQNQATTEKYVHALGLSQAGATRSLRWTTGSAAKPPPPVPAGSQEAGLDSGSRDQPEEKDGSTTNVIPFRRAK